MSDGRFPLADLQALERQVEGTPANRDGTMPFLKDGILAVVRAARAAEQQLTDEPASRRKNGKQLLAVETSRRGDEPASGAPSH
jgi:hypothetical protein